MILPIFSLPLSYSWESWEGIESLPVSHPPHTTKPVRWARLRPGWPRQRDSGLGRWGLNQALSDTLTPSSHPSCFPQKQWGWEKGLTECYFQNFQGVFFVLPSPLFPHKLKTGGGEGKSLSPIYPGILPPGSTAVQMCGGNSGAPFPFAPPLTSEARTSFPSEQHTQDSPVASPVCFLAFVRPPHGHHLKKNWGWVISWWQC